MQSLTCHRLLAKIDQIRSLRPGYDAAHPENNYNRWHVVARILEEMRREIRGDLREGDRKFPPDTVFVTSTADADIPIQAAQPELLDLCDAIGRDTSDLGYRRM